MIDDGSHAFLFVNADRRGQAGQLILNIMRNRFTQLVIWIVYIIVCTLPVKGQQLLSHGKTVYVEANDKFSLRRDYQHWFNYMKDSLIVYTERGEKVWKYERLDSSLETYEYNKTNDCWERASLTILPVPWEENEQVDSCYIIKGEKEIFFLHVPRGIGAPSNWGNTTGASWLGSYTTKEDSQGNLIEINPKNALFKMNYNSSGQIIRYEYISSNLKQTFSIINYTYSEDGKILLVEGQSAPTSAGAYVDGPLSISIKETNKYDKDGNLISTEHYEWSNDILAINRCSRLEITYGNNNNREMVYMYGWSPAAGRWTLDSYAVYYPNSVVADVVPNNNISVNNNGEGSFNLEVNLPSDLKSGTLTLSFPEGFSLTNVGLANEYEVLFTALADNSWFVEIKPKSTNRMELRTGSETTQQLHIEYKVNEDQAKGFYDISVNDIRFETNNGDFIPKPSVIVPVEVDYHAVSNEEIVISKPVVYQSGRTLYVETSCKEQLAVYTMSGQKIYQSTIQPGKTAIETTYFPKGILLLSGNSGWTRKILIR